MPTVRRDAFFLESHGGGRFCMVSRPEGESVGGLLFVHPFAEELNKSRRMVALAARAFAERGWTVLQIDCLGCGDSAADFGDAGWADWIEDISIGWEWLESQRVGPLALWGLRSGALLVADWLHESTEQPPLLLWQPVLNGKQHLNQFLRLKAVEEMLAESDAKAAMGLVRKEIQQGKTVEIAGYALSSPLISGVEAAVMHLPMPYASTVCVLEVGSSENAVLSPGIAMLVDRWTSAGVSMMASSVPGPAFWQTQEVETAPGLIEESLRALDRFSS